MSGPAALAERPVHLGPGGSAVPQPPFASGMAWYQAYEARHGGDGAEGRLVLLHSFDKPWDSWEMHPGGAEVVVCTAGEITLVQEFPDGRVAPVIIAAGQYAINPAGVWHTADVSEPATALFITAGIGTEVRPRLPRGLHRLR